MKTKPIALAVLFLLAALPSMADQVIPPQNFGPPYFYPDNAKDRLYRLPFTEGKSFTVTGVYGSDPATGYHHPDYSVDFNMGQGEPIRAVRAGRVNLIYPYDTVCNLPTSQGNKVIISHTDSMPDSTMANGWRKVTIKDLYLHVNHDIPVKPGQLVEQGQIIAYASCTGQDGGGPHLHFKSYIDSITGVWRHLGWFDTAPTYFFTSIPTPFMEITNHPNGLPEMGDTYVSDNTAPTAAEHLTGPLLSGTTLSLSPNPFHSGTAIVFQTTASMPLQLEIFSPSGQRTATLLNRELPAGLHRCSWTAGTELPCGVYLVRLKAGATVTTKKALLLR